MSSRVLTQNTNRNLVKGARDVPPDLASYGMLWLNSMYSNVQIQRQFTRNLGHP